MIGGVNLTVADGIPILLVILISIGYISVFLFLGIFVSTATKESSTSLVVSLLLWAFLVIIVPRIGGLISSKIITVPGSSEASNEASRQWSEAVRSYNSANPELAQTGLSGHWSPGEPLERAIVTADAWSKSYDDYRNAMINQVVLARNLTLISPAAVFQYGMESLACSGIFHYKSFFEQVLNFKLEQRQFLLDKYPLPLKWHWRAPNMSEEERDEMIDHAVNLKIDPDEIPKFNEKNPGIAEIIKRSLVYYVLLFLFAAVFFIAAFVKFLNYDVR